MLSGLHTWTLTAIAFAAGVAMLWAFGRCSDQARIELAKRKLRAHLLAFRLFSDEPRLIFRSQKQLLVWNARYLALMLRPTLVMILPLAALLLHLDAVYGRRALDVGETAIVTAQMDAATNLQTVSPSLAGRGVTVESPPLRLIDARQVLWRVRASGPAAGPRALVLALDGARMEKAVQAGSGLSYLSERRVATWLDWLRYPAESRLPHGAVEWVEVSYPSADIVVFGIGMHWLVWFCIVNLFTMLAFRKRFGVTF
ncbi:MAG: hypothetical protein ABSC08_02790 [Bryobacteraceae bacterium]|jgi:hypothetical protein